MSEVRKGKVQGQNEDDNDYVKERQWLRAGENDLEQRIRGIQSMLGDVAPQILSGRKATRRRKQSPEHGYEGVSTLLYNFIQRRTSNYEGIYDNGGVESAVRPLQR